LICIQAVASSLSMHVRAAGGPALLWRFVENANFLYGLPSVYMFARAAFGLPRGRAILHFIPFLANLPVAAALALAGIDQGAAVGAIPFYLLALAETIQLVAYAAACRGARKEAGSSAAARERGGIVAVILACYACYYALRWFGNVMRLLDISSIGSLSLPALVDFSGLSVIVSFLAAAGCYVLPRLGDLFAREAAASAKYARTPLDRSAAARIERDVERYLEGRDSLSKDEVSPRRIARRLGVPYHLLSRAVNEVAEKTLPDLIREERLRRAKILIDARPEATILDIALESGFGSKSSFNAAFKEATGMSPSDYRKSRLPARPT
jgi:AraC-like DNA-binding protein